MRAVRSRISSRSGWMNIWSGELEWCWLAMRVWVGASGLLWSKISTANRLSEGQFAATANFWLGRVMAAGIAAWKLAEIKLWVQTYCWRVMS